MDYQEEKCKKVEVDGVIASGNQFDIEIMIPEDNRDVIYGVLKDCFRRPICDAVVKLIEVEEKHCKKIRKPVSHTFTDKDGEFVFGPLCPHKKYEINFWADRVNHVKMCAKCTHEGECLEGVKMDSCEHCFEKPCDKCYDKQYEDSYERPYEKPYDKKCDKEYDKECEKKCDKPCDKEYDKEYGKECEKKCEKPYDKEYDKECEKKCEKPYDKEYDKECEKKCEKPYDKEYDKECDKKCEKPYGKECEKKCEKPYERPCCKPCCKCREENKKY